MKGAGWRRKVRQMTDGTAEGALRSITDNNSVVMSARAATWRLTHTHTNKQTNHNSKTGGGISAGQSEAECVLTYKID